MRLAGAALKQLEDRKQHAVSREDFDQAKAIKLEMDRLRSSVDARTLADDIFQTGRLSRDGGNDNSCVSQHFPTSEHPVDVPMLAAAVSQGACAREDLPPSVRSSEDDVASAAARVAKTQAVVRVEGPLNVDDIPATASGGYSHVPAGLQEYPPGQTPPDWIGHDTAYASDGLVNAGHGALGVCAPEMQSSREGTDHPLGGIATNILELEQPEFLSASHAKEASLVVQVFGEYLARCLWSKSWNLRDAALQKIQLELDEGNHGHSLRQLVQVMSIVLKRGVGDKIANIFLTSSLLLQHCVGAIFVHDDVSRCDVQAALDPVVPLVVARLSDSHPKIRGAVGESLMGLCRCPCIGSQYILQFVLRLPKKKNPNARLVCCRIYFLAALVEEQGLHPVDAPKDSLGVPLEPIMELACEHVEHPVQNVRGAIVALISSCYHIVGYRRLEPLLVNLRPAQRDVFEKAFEDKGSQAPRSGFAKHDYIFELSQPKFFSEDCNYDSQRNTSAAVAEEPAVSEAVSDNLVVPSVELSGANPGASISQRSSRVVSVRDHDAAADEHCQATEGPPFTCVFCQEQDPGFTPEGLDVHYWQQCPMFAQSFTTNGCESKLISMMGVGATLKKNNFGACPFWEVRDQIRGHKP